MSQQLNQHLLNSATQIIVRDFNIDEEKAQLQTEQDIDPSHLKQILAAEIVHLLEHDIGKLKWILYRVDVDEGKLQELLAQTAAADAPGVIAEKIIERQMEKARTRERYRRGEL